jgi:hypothetical protein
VIRVGRKLENSRCADNTIIQNVLKVKQLVAGGHTTVREEIFRRRLEMSDLSKKRIGMKSASQVRRFNETIDFILKEIHLIRLMEAGKL